jgi:hypothetical protein
LYGSVVKTRRTLLFLVSLPLLSLLPLALLGPASCSSFRNDTGGAVDSGADAGGVEASASDGAVDAGGDSTAFGADGGPSTDGSADSGDGSVGGDGGVCTSSTCPVTTVMGHLYGPAAVATDTTYVYWLEVGSMIPQAGGLGQLVRLKKGTTCADRSCVEVIDPYALSGTFEGQLIYDNQLAVSGQDVCYSQSFNAQSEHQISCFALTNLAQTLVDQDYGECDGIWIGPGSLVWSLASTSATSSDGSIRTRPIVQTDGGAAPAVASSRPDPTSVLADGAGVVWSELGVGDAGGAVLVAASDGGITPLVGPRGAPVAVAEYAGFVYWLDAQARTVVRTARAGGGAVDTIAQTDANPFALVVDPSGVYWASGGLTSPEGSVAHAPLVPGGPTTVMMTGVVAIQGMAVDATRVYVAAVGGTVDGGGSIVAIDKSR